MRSLPMTWPLDRGALAAPANYTGGPGDEFATVNNSLGTGLAPSFFVEGEEPVALPDDARAAAVRPWYLLSLLRLTFYQQCDLDNSCPF